MGKSGSDEKARSRRMDLRMEVPGEGLGRLRISDELKEEGKAE